ncbi:hypothetical protein K402DRAFT_458943 [Aulographum hederae CBS 113979]|uniref:F-box domain-containing protein n=1 Tax=Aulographum hederae CBS 113979 TaxID=1176131 RepID=A0A6G1HH55_9PEZI|nr:hypothetical protein K402DRAFT_458943 [Aulographum hederae CBS 113979]
MNSLPTELVAQIISELSCEWKPQLARYATINTHWQDVVESQTFQKLRLSSLEFARFCELFGHEHANTALDRRRCRRRAKLRHLEYNIRNAGLLQGLDNIKYIQNDPHFLKSYGRRLWLSIHEIWEHLASWKPTPEHPGLPSLAISSLAIILPLHPWKEETSRWDHIEKKESRSFNHPIPYVVYGSSDISPDSSIQLSPLASVKRFWMGGSQLWPADLVKVAENLSAVREVCIWASDWEEEGETLDAAARDELARRLSNLPQGIRVLVLELPFESDYDSQYELIDLCSVGDFGQKIDHFSCSVRATSYFLTSLILTVGMISPELFWPANPVPNGQNNELFWPNLETFKVITSMCTAYGTYALENPDRRYVHRFNPWEAGSYDWETELDDEIGFYNRQRPDHQYHNTLAMSIAKAASRMPRLKDLKLLMKTDWTRKFKRHEFSFRAEAVPCGNPRVQWSFECNEAQLLGWQPPLEARDLWIEKCGPSLQEDIVTIVVLDVEAGGDVHWQDFCWDDKEQTYPVRKRGGVEMEKCDLRDLGSEDDTDADSF